MTWAERLERDESKGNEAVQGCHVHVATDRSEERPQPFIVGRVGKIPSENLEKKRE
jgi:hypothetical protein